MHEFSKEIMECVKAKVKGIGIDNIEGQHLEELEKWCCIADKIVEYDYYYHIVEAMKKAEEEGDEEATAYYTRMRDSRGRYMRGYEDGMRRGYEEGRSASNSNTSGNSSRNYTMTPEMYHEHSPEYLRDMDRKHGKMYYTESSNGSSRYDSAKRHYTDNKQTNPNDEQGNLKAIENIANVLTEDIMEMKPKMSQAEKTMMKQKLANAMNQL